MKVVWLGQAGLLLDFSGIKVMVDPYLSNSVEKINPRNYRRQPIDAHFFEIKPDILVLTHNHLDHTDPETLDIIFSKHENICVLASGNAWQVARKHGATHNYVLFNRGTVWTEKGITFKAVYAEHSDTNAIGVILSHGDKTYYIAGDTLYNEKVINDIGTKPDIAFVPINGVGNNMNMHDAETFSKKIGAKLVVPIHWGMFDEINPNDFHVNNKVIPTIYEEIVI